MVFFFNKCLNSWTLYQFVKDSEWSLFYTLLLNHERLPSFASIRKPLDLEAVTAVETPRGL